MTIIMVIVMVNIADAKAKLSELVEAVWRGEQVIICNRNEPVAELRTMDVPRKTPRDLTPLFSDWTVDPAFFDPLDAEQLDAWSTDTRRSDARPTESRSANKPRRGSRRRRP
jgi:prevent-host-death family protein